MSYCENCGNKISENVKFCPFCGFNLKSKDQELKNGIDENIFSEENEKNEFTQLPPKSEN